MSQLPLRPTVETWIRDCPEIQFDGIDLYCTSCKKSISWKTKTNIVRHVSSAKHQKSVGGANSDPMNSDGQRNFNLDLVEVMIGCNIPWTKLDNPLFRQFLQKCISGQYITVTVPSESTLRNNYASPACDNKKQRISFELNGKYIWLNVNETTSTSGSKVVNVLVGGLEENCSVRGHLISSKVPKTVNSGTVVEIVNSSLRTLWGDKYKENRDKFLLLITNSVSYMKCAGRILNETYQNLLHITCLASGLHEVAETIRECYPNINKLMTNVKEVFHKASNHRRLFLDILPDTPLPPEPIFTRCGNWILAVSYYYSNFDDIKSVMEHLNSDDAFAVETRRAFFDPATQEDLGYIHGHFSRIPLAIRKLERKPDTTEFTVIDAMNVVFDLRGYIFQLQGDIADIVKQKFKTVLKDNPGFLTMSHIVDLLNGKEVDFATPGLNVASLKKFTYFKFARVTSADVEVNSNSLRSTRWVNDV